MDVIAMVKEYVNKMVSEVTGLKSLLLDEETSGIVSMVYSRSNILEKEVFLMDLLSRAQRERMAHLKCVVFVRPTFDNVALIQKELKEPKYGEYHIFFSNIASRQFLEQMAVADENDLVKQVQEFYGDFFAISSDLFSLNIPSVAPLANGNWDLKVFNRISAGVLSVLLAMKRRPMIRFQANSTMCDRLAAELKTKVEAEHSLFDFRRSENTLLLLLDRKEDPITPILTQWTYQAMIHELLGIRNNRVTIKQSQAASSSSSSSSTTDEQSATKDKETDNEVVLSEVDPFFNKNMYCNWGDLCMKLKQFVDEFKKKSDMTSNVQSIEDIKTFMRDFPAFRNMSGNVSKHVSLVSEIGELIQKRELLTISVLEQEMSCYHNHAEHYDKMCEVLQNPRIDPLDCLRLVLIYALRYEKRKEGNALAQFRDILQKKGLPDDKLALIDAMMRYGGAKARCLGLFHKEGIGKIITNLAKGFKDVNNVYTQHEPQIKNILQQLSKATLSTDLFPYLPGFVPQAASKFKPKEIIIFIVGGATFEEALFVNAFNDPTNANNSANAMQESKTRSDVRCILGGTSVLNSQRFLEEVAACS